MAWNYRILDHGDHFALHEVYYDAAGTPNGWTERPIEFVCDTDDGPQGVIGSLEMALADARKHPVLKVKRGKLAA